MKKNEHYPKYVQAMHLMDAGYSPNYIEKALHMSRYTIKVMRSRYLRGGELALLDPQHRPNLDKAAKLRIVLDIEKNALPLSVAAQRYECQPGTLRRWLHAYRKSGEAGLERKPKNTMRKKRQRTQAEQDELEMLRERVEYLEIENALLKKVKALVEEREARLRTTGRKPSKD